MENSKKNYETPQVTMHGTVEDLTLTGGVAYVDVPQGTPNNGNVTGSHP